MDSWVMFTTVSQLLAGICLSLVTSMDLPKGPKVLSMVIDSELNGQESIQIVNPPTVFQNYQWIQVSHLCSRERIVGVELVTNLEDNRNVKIFQKVWRCRKRTEIEKQKHVRLKVAPSVAYNYNYFNTQTKVALNTKLRAWMLDPEIWKWSRKTRDSYHRSNIKVSYDLEILPPFSRPLLIYPSQCKAWSFFILAFLSSKHIPQCRKEPAIVEAVQYPAVMNGLAYGIIKVFPPYFDKSLEAGRIASHSNPKFTVSIWLYVLEYCTNPQSGLCSIMHHYTWRGAYLTPLLFLTNEGKIHVQVNFVNNQSSAALTFFQVPLHQWCRLVFMFSGRGWKLVVNYGEKLNQTLDTNFRFAEDIYLDDTEGLFTFGGAESTPSFRGYIGQATFYRNKYMEPHKIPYPSPYHPMFELRLLRREEKCASYIQWMNHRTHVSRNQLVQTLRKRSCQQPFYDLVMSLRSKILRQQKQPVCSATLGLKPKHWKVASRLVKQQVFAGKQLSSKQIADALYEKATSTIEHKIDQIPSMVPLLKQAACFGNADAMYMLAVILNNGIFIKKDEIQAHAYLMLAALDRHRLSTLALAHKHRYGLDGVTEDLELAYMYFKYVADTTREDKELHKDTDVLTESVRLTDEVAVKEQTDENGDIFNWLKHQAKQGVMSAQSHVARTLYWGSQGLKRNLGAALEYFKMSAETEDPQAMYDYGIILIRGQGTEKDVKEGLVQLTKSAEKKNPSALNALGWYAMNFNKNFTAAAEYFEQAYKMGNPDAAHNLGILHLGGQYPNKEMDADLALSYFNFAAVRGQIDAGVAIAYQNIKGTDKTPRSVFVAVEWARYIAEKNPAIGFILRKGIQAYRHGDIQQAILYYMMAADAGAEIGSFNLAWLCEENRDGIVNYIEKDCQWRHYNHSTLREPQFVDSYAYIKMGDYHWYGCEGQQDVEKAAEYYAQAAKKNDPHAIYNLGFMLEEGARIKRSVWKSIRVPEKALFSNVTLLEYLYTRCKESPKTEAYLPCSIALYRIQLLEIWTRYRIWIKMSSLIGVTMVTVLSVYSFYRHHYSNHIQLEENTI